MQATLIPKYSEYERGMTLEIYHMDPPYCGNEYIAISAVDRFMVFSKITETYIFPANKEGVIINYGELEGSRKGIIKPSALLRELNYVVN